MPACALERLERSCGRPACDSCRPSAGRLAAVGRESTLGVMSSLLRRRKSPPSRAKRNIRWAAVALLALSLAPTESSDSPAPDATAMLAVDADATETPPVIADGSDLDHALDFGADAMPTE